VGGKYCAWSQESHGGHIFGMPPLPALTDKKQYAASSTCIDQSKMVCLLQTSGTFSIMMPNAQEHLAS